VTDQEVSEMLAVMLAIAEMVRDRQHPDRARLAATFWNETHTRATFLADQLERLEYN
jgi:hypothetical protein